MTWAEYARICREAKQAKTAGSPYTWEGEKIAQKQFEQTCDKAFRKWQKARRETK